MSAPTQKMLQHNLMEDLYPNFAKQPWLDIPNEDAFVKLEANETATEVTAALAASSSVSRFSHLIQTIKKYHSLEKTNKNNLTPRIQLLTEIHEQADKHLQDLTLTLFMMRELTQLKTQSQGKLLYLKAIQPREENPVKFFFKFKFGGTSKSGLLLRTLRPDYLEEATALSYDPCEREKQIDPKKSLSLIKELFEEWQKEVASNSLNSISSFDSSNFSRSSNSTIPSFYLWLETKDSITQNIPPLKAYPVLLQLRKYDYSSGHILSQTKTPITGEDFNFILTPEEELYLSSEKCFYSMPYHSQLLHPHIPVVCSGEMSLVQGKISKITNVSGHYAPNPLHLKQTICLFQSYYLFTEDASVWLWSVNHGWAKDKWIDLKNFHEEELDFNRMINGKWLTNTEIFHQYGSPVAKCFQKWKRKAKIKPSCPQESDYIYVDGLWIQAAPKLHRSP